MKSASLVVFALCARSFCAATIVAYIPDWEPTFTWRNIDFTQVTHLDWAFAIPDGDGNLSVLDPDNIPRLDSIVSAAHAAGVKVLISVGGGDGSSGFSAMAASPVARAKLCHQVEVLLAARRLDGVDIDWETPAASDTANLVPFLRQLRDSIGAGKLLTLAVPCSDWNGKWFPLARAMGAIDWLGVMTYDITGGWDDHGGYNAPLYPHGAAATWSVSQSMDYWVSVHGAPKSKLLAGTPLYGYVFRQCAGPGSPFTGAVDYVSSTTIARALRDSGWMSQWDATSQVPWATTPSGGYVTWNDGQAAAAEGRWLVANGYPGTIVWELTQDWMGGAKHPVMDSVRTTLLAGSAGVRTNSGPSIASIRRRVDLAGRPVTASKRGVVLESDGANGWHHRVIVGE
jgi:chitinase